MTKQWFVYIVECADGSLYTGISADLAKRIKVHNAGRGAAYTRQRRPVRLVYQEVAVNRSAALKREYEIKQLRRSAKESLFA